MSTVMINEVIKRSPETDSDHRLLCHMAHRADVNGEGVWCHPEAFADELNLCVRTIQRSLKLLFKRGRIEVMEGRESPAGKEVLRIILPASKYEGPWGRKKKVKKPRRPSKLFQVSELRAATDDKSSPLKRQIVAPKRQDDTLNPKKLCAAQGEDAPVRVYKGDIREEVVVENDSVLTADHHHFSVSFSKFAEAYRSESEYAWEIAGIVQEAVDRLRATDKDTQDDTQHSTSRQSEETSAIFGIPDFDVSDVATPIEPTPFVEEFRGAIAEDDYMNDDIDDAYEVDDLDVQDDTFDVGSIIRAAPSVNRLRGGVAKDNEDTELQEARPRKKKGKKETQYKKEKPRTTRENLARFFGKFTDQLLGEVSKKHGFERSAWLELNAEQIEEARVYSTEKRREGKNFRTVLIARLDDLAAASLPQKPRKSVSKHVEVFEDGKRVEIAGKAGVGTIEGGNASESVRDEPSYWIKMDSGHYHKARHRDLTVSNVPAPAKPEVEDVVGTKWRYNACGTVVTVLEGIGSHATKTDDGKEWVFTGHYLHKVATRTDE